MIIEIGKRGMRGYYFSYEQYQEIKKIKHFDDLKQRLLEYGYSSVKDAKNSKEIVEKLNIKQNEETTIWIAVEMIFWFILSLATCS